MCWETLSFVEVEAVGMDVIVSACEWGADGTRIGLDVGGGIEYGIVEDLFNLLY